jgi:photosystem II stability/assembly factor-like uncharacterized protein
VVLHTINGGKNWYLQISITSQSLWDVCFSNKNNGWIVGSADCVLHTNDAGEHWQVQVTGINKLLRSVHFVNADTGWIISNDGVVLSTKNGGRNWDILDTLQYVNHINFRITVMVGPWVFKVLFTIRRILVIIGSNRIQILALRSIVFIL